MQSRKTHEQEIRTIERKGDVPKTTEDGTSPDMPERHVTHPEARQSEMPVSRGGMNQESRQHNKHNHAPKGGERG